MAAADNNEENSRIWMFRTLWQLHLSFGLAEWYNRPGTSHSFPLFFSGAESSCSFRCTCEYFEAGQLIWVLAIPLDNWFGLKLQLKIKRNYYRIGVGLQRGRGGRHRCASGWTTLCSEPEFQRSRRLGVVDRRRGAACACIGRRKRHLIEMDCWTSWWTFLRCEDIRATDRLKLYFFLGVAWREVSSRSQGLIFWRMKSLGPFLLIEKKGTSLFLWVQANKEGGKQQTKHWPEKAHS
jgi:hypothetical protein